MVLSSFLIFPTMIVLLIIFDVVYMIFQVIAQPLILLGFICGKLSRSDAGYNCFNLIENFQETVFRNLFNMNKTEI